MTSKYYLALLLVVLIVHTQTQAQKRKEIPPESPKLVVGIVIEDMRYDYIYRFWDNFGEGGFKRLIGEGTLCKNAKYNYLLTQTSPGFATIATGCEPQIHGIVADRWFQRIQNNKTYAVFDEKQKTVGTANDVYPNSPINLMTTTFSDELKLFNNGRSKVVGISFKPESAILSTGHLANAAYWFDDATGNWVSSSYYLDSLPIWVNQFNAKKFPDIYLEREWLPLLPEEKYRNGSKMGLSKEVGFAADNKFAKRIGSFIKRDAHYGILKATPFGITLTKDFALAAIIDEQLGVDDFTDYLSIGFASTSRISESCGPNSIELEDLYLRLDAELEHLLQFLDDQFGKHNVLVYVTSDHGTSYNPEDLQAMRIPAGVFNAERAVMLLGTYLNALYDKGKWISEYYNKQIYLNHRLIEDANMKISDMQDVVAQFMIQFTGVSNAVTGITLEQTHFNDGVFAFMQNSFNQKRSGDVMINLDPGWIEKGDYIASANSANNYDVHVPLIWYGWKIKRERISRTIYMEDVAPTIANFLNIPFPNGCTGSVISELEN
jgi:predicted AlkP superfamily pyrophosphatase or phosphodiesterase